MSVMPSGEEVQPDFALTIAADSFVVAPDMPLTIPVTVDRRDGMKDPIEVRIVGLAEGMMSAPVISQPEGETAKAVSLVIQSAAGVAGQSAGSRPIQIIGASMGSTPRVRSAAFPVAGIRGRHSDVWLTGK